MATTQLLSPLDPRTNAFDQNLKLAEIALEQQLGPHWDYVSPQRGAATKRLSLRSGLDQWSTQVTEALPGEALEFLWETNETYAYVRTMHDHYLGWIFLEDFESSVQFTQEVGQKITALRAHAFSEPKVSAKIVDELCLGALVWVSAPEEHVDKCGTSWKHVHLANNQEAWIHSECFAPRPEQNPTELALRLLDTPYVWGGRSAWGLDCSGLVQLVHQYFGQPLPRDSDQQQAALEAVKEPQRGDLAFFPGHVGIMLDQHQMLHANGKYMRVTINTLGEGEYGQMLKNTCTGFGRWAQ